jgi:hypothetical protein
VDRDGAERVEQRPVADAVVEVLVGVDDVRGLLGATATTETATSNQG